MTLEELKEKEYERETARIEEDHAARIEMMKKTSSLSDATVLAMEADNKLRSTMVALELKRQLADVGVRIAEYEAQLPVVTKGRGAVESMIFSDQQAGFNRVSTLIRIDEWLAGCGAAHQFNLKRMDALKTELLQHLTKEA